MLPPPMRSSPLVSRLAKVKVVVLGDLVADEYVFGETERVSREAPVLIVRHESTETKPGGAGNAAANVAALGATARPVGVVGRDPAGLELVKQFQALGAVTAGVVASTARRTETKTRILAGGRSTTRQQMLRVDRADERPLSPTLRALLLRRFENACADADSVIVSDYGSGLFDDALVDHVRTLAKHKPVCVDSRYGVRRFTGVTLAKPNEPELEAAFGGRLRSPEDVERAGRMLLDALAVKALVVTRGRLGMWLFLPGKKTIQIPVWGPAEAVDVTGAGDTVLAALAAALGAGASFEEAARLANVAGGIVVQKQGTATCSRAELAAAVGSEPLRGRA
jgi:rfaE bifunctional protein kinase chain/domain